MTIGNRAESGSLAARTNQVGKHTMTAKIKSESFNKVQLSGQTASLSS